MIARHNHPYIIFAVALVMDTLYEISTMSDELEKHVIRKYDILQKLGKGVSPIEV